MLRNRSYILSESVNKLKDKWVNKGVSISISERRNVLTLHLVRISDEYKNKGVGTKFMKELISYADNTNQKIALTPSKDFGASISRLKKFYKRFGFVDNKGRNKDFEISETMYREPK